jgi:hypothetical protein
MMSRADAERSELWLESVERYHERQRQEHRARWYAFHADMADLHARLSEEHAQKAEALCSEGEKGEHFLPSSPFEDGSLAREGLRDGHVLPPMGASTEVSNQ